MGVRTVIKLEQTNTTDLRTLYAELAALRTENRALKAVLPKSKRYSSTVRRALADSHQLLMNAFSGDSTGCLSMRAEGMTKRRWGWAVAVLRYAGIVSTGRRRWRSGLEWLIIDLDSAVRQLENAGVELDSPDGYKRLRALLRQV